MNKAAKCFELFEGDIPVAFIAILHQPTKQRLPLKRVSRLVVLPDYQGIGIGRAFLDAIAELYMEEGWMFEIKTSAKNLISSLRHSPEWRMTSYGFSHAVGKTGKVRAEPRKECKTATFVKRGGQWSMHDYSIAHRQKRGNIDQNKTLRTQCKVATFRGVING